MFMELKAPIFDKISELFLHISDYFSSYFNANLDHT